eukprot:2285878-Amphidinium_carterae.3
MESVAAMARTVNALARSSVALPHNLGFDFSRNLTPMLARMSAATAEMEGTLNNVTSMTLAHFTEEAAPQSRQF